MPRSAKARAGAAEAPAGAEEASQLQAMRETLDAAQASLVEVQEAHIKLAY